MGYHIYCDGLDSRRRERQCQCIEIGRTDDPINNCSNCGGDGVWADIDREGPTIEWGYSSGDPIFQVIGWTPVGRRRFHRLVDHEDLDDMKRRIEFACRNKCMRERAVGTERKVYLTDHKGRREASFVMSDFEVVKKLHALHEVVCFALEQGESLVIG